MLKRILSISGKPGLFELVSQGKNMLILESLTEKKRVPAYTHEKILSLGDIAIYTEDGEVPLVDVLRSMKEKENGQKVGFDPKKADGKQLAEYLGEVLPNFDRNRVYSSDIKKLIAWYNILVESGKDDFEEKKSAAAPAEEAK